MRIKEENKKGLVSDDDEASVRSNSLRVLPLPNSATGWQWNIKHITFERHSRPKLQNQARPGPPPRKAFTVGLERWFPGYEHILPLQRNQVLFPAPHQTEDNLCIYLYAVQVMLLFPEPHGAEITLLSFAHLHCVAWTLFINSHPLINEYFPNKRLFIPGAKL